MPLSLTCDCGARFDVEEALAGQSVSCPECQATLKAPAARRPVVRTSNFALASFLLAIVGAFTVVGTIAAVVLGLIAVAAILRDRERLAGLGFAVTGIVLGIAFTALTLFSFSQLEFFGGAMRRAQMADQLDKKVDPKTAVEIKESDFRITKPINWWQANKDFAYLLVEPLLRSDAVLLLVQPEMYAFVDVQVGSIAPGENIDKVILDRIKPDPSNGNPNPKVEQDQEDVLRIQDAKVTSSKLLPPDLGMEIHELTVDVRLDNKNWTMLIRTFQNRGGRLFIVRGFTQSSHFGRAKDDLLKVMDSFKIGDGS